MTSHTRLWRAMLSARRLLARMGALRLRVGRFVPATLILRAGNALSARIAPPASATVMTLPTGQRIAIPAHHPHARTYLAGAYEPDLTRLMLSLLDAGMAFVDVGADIGYYTLLGSARVGPGGHVYAFEPDPQSHAALVANVARHANVTVIALAVADRSGAAPLFQRERGRSGLAGTAAEQAAVPVRTTTLDEALGDRRVDVVKLDIEGGEAAALRGMLRLCRLHRPRLVVELNAAALRLRDSGPEEYVHALGACGFRRYFLVEDRLRPVRLPEDLPWLLPLSETWTLNLLCEPG